MRTKAVQLLVNSNLPPELRDYNRELDSKSLGDLLAQIARKHPDQYESIAKKLSDIGRKASYYQGETLTLSDMKPVIDRGKVFDEMDAKLDLAKKKYKDPERYEEERLNIWMDYANRLEKMTSDAALKKGSNLAYSVMSGARGKPAQLKMMVTTPALYTDAQDNTVPLFIRNSFGDGLRPAEYLAGTYGARKSVLATKRATAKGGDLAKQMVQASAPIVISEHDCGVKNGLDLDVDDNSLRGRVLGQETAGIKAGTLIDRHVMAQIRKSGSKKVIARSPMTCQSREGICSKCVGVNAEGGFNPVGESIGITATQAIGEPICLLGTTMVRMADWSSKQIKDIKPGEYVLGSDMYGRLKPTKVVNVFHNGPRPCVETFIRKGRGANSEVVSMVSTREHKTLCWSSKESKPHIRPIGKDCDRLGVYMSTGVDTDQGTRESWAGLLGVLLGDGSYGGSNREVILSCYESETLKWVKEQAEKHDCIVKHVTDGEYHINKRKHVGPCNVVSNPVKLKLIELEMWSQTCSSKKLPKGIWDWDQQSVAEFIGGYFAADGWITGEQGVIGFNNTSKDLVKEIKDLLEVRFGIYANRITKKYKKHPDGGTYEPSYEVTVSAKPDIREFSRAIPIPGVKSEKLQKAIDSHVKTASGTKRGRYTILEQVDVGIQDTWDIEIDNDTHLFNLSNNLIVSNTQGALNTKHQGGAAGGAKREYSGFNYINQFVQTPELFPDRATVAQEEGVVTKVREAAQGGNYVQVGDKEHYIPPGYPLLVKPGDSVEAGDQLAEGLVDPGEIVELRGLGSGRRYYRDRLIQMLGDSGMPTDARNVEVLSRAALDHVQVNDAEEDDDYLPDDVLSYSYLQSKHIPPADAVKTPLKGAVGKYLQSPALHYTVGTKITPRMTKRLKDAGFNDLITSQSSPKFSSHMVRLRAASHNNPDWLASMHTSYLKKQIQDASMRGRDTNVEQNIHFAPRLAAGEGFGEKIDTTGKF